MSEELQSHRRLGQLESDLLLALKRIARLEAEKAALQHIADEDPLTGTYNRRGFNARLQAIEAIIERNKESFRQPKPSYVTADIDRFKEVNDTYGHPAGDEVLRQFAGLLRNNVRGYDIVGRFGGEEFVIALIDATPEESAAKAELIAEKVRSHSFSLPKHEPIHVTASFGVGGSIDSSDSALYQAKQGGRDQVVIDSSIN